MTGTSQQLRELVREVLREVIPQKATATGVETVRIANDSDLASFVARLTEPATAEAVRAGKLRFTLTGAPSVAPPPSAPSAVLTGVITEQKIQTLNGATVLVLSADAVLTPLARDKARRLGLKLERRR